MTLKTDCDLADDPEQRGLVTRYTHVKYESPTLTNQKIWPV